MDPNRNKDHVGPVHHTREPMLRFNGSGYGVEWTKILQLVIFVAGLIWFGGAAMNRLDTLETKLSVAPKEVLNEVRALQDKMDSQLSEIRRSAETARIERGREIHELEKRASASESDRSQLNAQVDNLTTIMKDIHDLVTKQYGGNDVHKGNDPSG